MRNKWWLILSLSLALSACSNAKREDDGAKRNPANDKSFTTCQASFQNGPGCVAIQWETFPTSSQYGSFLLKIGQADSSSGALQGQDPTDPLAVELMMPNMGHGSSPVQIEHVSTGVFRVSHVFFTMPGNWEIWIELKNGDHVKDRAIIYLSI